MSYETIRDALLETLREVEGITVAYEDHQPLNSGTRAVAVLRYDGFTPTRNGFGGGMIPTSIIWNFELRIFTDGSGDRPTAVLFQDEIRERVIDALMDDDSPFMQMVDDGLINSTTIDRNPQVVGEVAFLQETYKLQALEFRN